MIYVVVRWMETGYQHLSGRVPLADLAPCEVKDIVFCIEAGAEEYITKPVQATLLEARIAANLEVRDLRARERTYRKRIDADAETIERLIYGRKSIRQFKPEPVPDHMIRRILKAGLYAPHGCNVGCTRFLVLRDPEEQKLVSSDIPIENCVMIVVLQELSMYHTLRFEKFVPQNLYYDAAAAATASESGMVAAIRAAQRLTGGTQE